MNKVQQYKEWFDEFNEEWLAGAYLKTDYDYPVGYHRLRILLKAISEDNLKGKKVLDIGCGGGDISFALAQKGANVVGIDMSDGMLGAANDRRTKMPENIKGHVEFRKENILELSDAVAKEKYDYIIAFGLIGYLESDEKFFDIVQKISKKNTVLFLSCRNELFNITSVSANTVKEINTGNAFSLIDEINRYYEKEIPYEKSQIFLSELNNSIKQINTLEHADCAKKTSDSVDDDSIKISFARQSTPETIQKIAAEYSYRFCKYWGVHPHLLLPKFNKKLPPRVYNILSDALCVFEDEEISLIWSSVFVGKFVKE